MSARVLIIDDCRVTTLIVQRYLERFEFEIRAAATGEEGLRIAAEFRPDAILLDRQLPGIDGVEVCRRLREMDATRATPVLMLTGTHDSRARVEALEIGADDYIIKPFVPDELRARISRFLTTRGEYSDRIVEERRTAIGQIALGVRHEINNPLSVVIGRIELVLRNRSIDARDRAHLEEALSSARRIQSLVNTTTETPADQPTSLGGNEYISLVLPVADASPPRS